MEGWLEFTGGVAIPAMALLAIVLILVNARVGSPNGAILVRWLRWIVAAYFLAVALEYTGLIHRPFWVLMSIGFLGWFVLETGYNWFAIDALSKSSLPLFPRYRENKDGDEWPNQKRYIALRDWLRRRKFKRRAGLVAVVEDHVLLRSSVFENDAKTIRLQIVFLPHRNANVTDCCSVTSVDPEGHRLITDNFFLPFGGFYPENWHLERRPWMRSVEALVRRHMERMDAFVTSFEPFTSEPVEDLNHQQAVLERVNSEMGFLTPYEQREEHGKITREGRYRVWKELWLLSYLGIARNY